MPAWNKISIPKDVLANLYQKKGLSLHRIAKRLGTSTSPVVRSLNKYHIPIRNLSVACTKVPVTKVQLKKWYFKDKLSMFEIAKRLNCTHSAIVLKFQKFGLKSRGCIGLTRPIKLNKKNFEYLYYDRNLSLSKIAKIAHCSESGLERRFKKYGLKSRGTKNRVCKYKKYDFSGDPIEKAYMIGFRLGDLNVIKHVSTIQVRCSTTIFAQTRLIRTMFSKYTTPHIWKAKRGTTEIACSVNNSFGFLIPKSDEVPNWILKHSKTFWSFFAGYADAEGSLSILKNKSKQIKQRINFDISSYDKHILSTIREKLEKFQIKSYFRLKSPKGTRVGKTNYFSSGDAWNLAVSTKQSLWDLIQYWKIYSKHGNKLRRIKFAESNLTKRNEIRWSKPINLNPVSL